MGSTTGSRFIEVLSNAQLGPHQFTSFVQQNQPPEADDTNQNLLIGARKRKRSLDPLIQADLSSLSAEVPDPVSQLKKKSKSNNSRDFNDGQFRRLLLSLLNKHLPPQSQKTRLPRGFFGPYLAKNGLELVGLPEKPVEIGEGGKIGGWSADALRRNLDAVKANTVFIRRIGGADGTAQVVNVNVEGEPEVQRAHDGGDVEEAAARILAGGRRGRRGATLKTLK